MKKILFCTLSTCFVFLSVAFAALTTRGGIPYPFGVVLAVVFLAAFTVFLGLAGKEIDKAAKKKFPPLDMATEGLAKAMRQWKATVTYESREARLKKYGEYLGLCNVYGWPISERGFEGFLRTGTLRPKWLASARRGERNRL